MDRSVMSFQEGKNNCFFENNINGDNISNIDRCFSAPDGLGVNKGSRTMKQDSEKHEVECDESKLDAKNLNLPVDNAAKKHKGSSNNTEFITHSVSDLSVTSSIAGILDHAKKRQYYCKSSPRSNRRTNALNPKSSDDEDLPQTKQKNLLLHAEDRVPCLDDSLSKLTKDTSKSECSTIKKRQTPGLRHCSIESHTGLDTRNIPSSISVRTEEDNISDDISMLSRISDPPKKLRELHSLATEMSLKLRVALNESRQDEDESVMKETTQSDTLITSAIDGDDPKMKEKLDLSQDVEQNKSLPNVVNIPSDEEEPVAEEKDLKNSIEDNNEGGKTEVICEMDVENGIDLKEGNSGFIDDLDESCEMEHLVGNDQMDHRKDDTCEKQTEEKIEEVMGNVESLVEDTSSQRDDFDESCAAANDVTDSDVKGKSGPLRDTAQDPLPSGDMTKPSDEEESNTVDTTQFPVLSEFDTETSDEEESETEKCKREVSVMDEKDAGEKDEVYERVMEDVARLEEANLSCGNASVESCDKSPDEKENMSISSEFVKNNIVNDIVCDVMAGINKKCTDGDYVTEDPASDSISSNGLEESLPGKHLEEVLPLLNIKDASQDNSKAISEENVDDDFNDEVLNSIVKFAVQSYDIRCKTNSSQSESEESPLCNATGLSEETPSYDGSSVYSSPIRCSSLDYLPLHSIRSVSTDNNSTKTPLQSVSTKEKEKISSKGTTDYMQLGIPDENSTALSRNDVLEDVDASQPSVEPLKYNSSAEKKNDDVEDVENGITSEFSKHAQPSREKSEASEEEVVPQGTHASPSYSSLGDDEVNSAEVELFTKDVGVPVPEEGYILENSSPVSPKNLVDDFGIGTNKSFSNKDVQSSLSPIQNEFSYDTSEKTPDSSILNAAISSSTSFQSTEIHTCPPENSKNIVPGNVSVTTQESDSLGVAESMTDFISHSEDADSPVYGERKLEVLDDLSIDYAPEKNQETYSESYCNGNAPTPRAGNTTAKGTRAVFEDEPPCDVTVCGAQNATVESTSDDSGVKPPLTFYEQERNSLPTEKKNNKREMVVKSFSSAIEQCTLGRMCCFLTRECKCVDKDKNEIVEVDATEVYRVAPDNAERHMSVNKSELYTAGGHNANSEIGVHNVKPDNAGTHVQDSDDQSARDYNANQAEELGVEQDFVEFSNYLTEVGTSIAMEASLPLQVIHRSLGLSMGEELSEYNDVESSSGIIPSRDMGSSSDEKSAESSSNIGDRVESSSGTKGIVCTSDVADVDVSHLSCEMMIRHAAIRSIAAQSLTDKMHNGYSIKSEGITCEKCCMPLMQLNSQSLQCVVCPAIGSNLARVVGELKDNDWYFQQKTKLEAELNELKTIAKEKLDAASKARDAEFSTCVEKRVIENEVKRIADSVADAETAAKERSRCRSDALIESEKITSNLGEALESQSKVEGTVEGILSHSEEARLEAEKDYFHMVKNHELAKLRVHDAKEALRKAIEDHEVALMHLQQTKEQIAPAKALLDELTLEKEWKMAGAKSMLSEEDKRVSTLKKLKADTEAALSEEEAKSAEIIRKAKAALSDKKAELDALTNEAKLARHERETSERESTQANAAVNSKLNELNVIMEKMKYDHLNNYGVNPLTSDLIQSVINPIDCGVESSIDVSVDLTNKDLDGKSSEIDNDTEDTDTEDTDTEDPGNAVHEDTEENVSSDKDVLSVIEMVPSSDESTSETEVNSNGHEKVIVSRDFITSVCSSCDKKEIEQPTDLMSKGTATTTITDQEDDTICSDTQSNEYDNSNNDLSLQSVSKEGSDTDENVAKDIWEGYYTICKLFQRKQKYNHAFNILKMDPLYPYLNAMEGINSTPCSFEGDTKNVRQRKLEKYADMSQGEIAEDQVKLAVNTLPKLTDICKELAGCLGIKTIGIGSTKEVSDALKKADSKYGGDVLSITDYCRSFIVVKDIATLLALIELLWYSLGPLVRRIKLSTLKDSRRPLLGGYRDCKINLEIDGHVCEIQVHLSAMWNINDVKGFEHYKNWQEQGMDSFHDPYDALLAFDEDTINNLISLAEDKVSCVPLDLLTWDDKDGIDYYFALVGLYLSRDLALKAENILIRLLELDCDSADSAPNILEMRFLQNHLEKALRQQGKAEEADKIADDLLETERNNGAEKQNAGLSIWNSFSNPGEVLDLIIDPNKKEREEEEQMACAVLKSKEKWLEMRKKRFACLKAVQASSCPAMYNVIEPQY